jgi:hypothetical protein
MNTPGPWGGVHDERRPAGQRVEMLRSERGSARPPARHGYNARLRSAYTGCRIEAHTRARRPVGRVLPLAQRGSARSSAYGLLPSRGGTARPTTGRQAKSATTGRWSLNDHGG